MTLLNKSCETLIGIVVPPEADMLAEMWRELMFADRLRELAPIAVVLGNKDFADQFDLGWAPNISELVNRPDVSSTGTLLLLEATQFFADSAVLRNGFLKARQHSADYFTQWEHCRLPVGVGGRFAAVARLRAERVDTFDEFLERMRADPQNFNAKYDDTKYCSYDESLLDSRWQVGAKFRSGVSLTLAGFLSLASKQAADALRYQALPDAPIIDHRGMPAGFGFESAACAEFPTYVMFDLTNHCNAHCVHCPQSVGFAGQGTPKFLDFGLFRKIIDECSQRHIDFVRITADGEPLLHPSIWEMLDYSVRQQPGPVGLTTNGSALNNKNIERLLDSGVYVVDISLDAFSQETYEKVRAGLSYLRTVANVEKLLQRRLARNAKMHVMVSFVKQEANCHEVDDFIDYWGSRVDKVLIREMISNVGLTQAGHTDSLTRWPCPHWFRRMVINYDGRLKACPIDWQNQLAFEHAENTSLESAWHGDFYHTNRQEHLNDTYLSGSICAKCRDWQGTPWTLGYEKVVKNL